MTFPNMDQTEGIWIERTHNQGYHYVQDVFSSENPRERYHQDNCRLLIVRGSLQPEVQDGLAPSQRIWQKTLRYAQVIF